MLQRIQTIYYALAVICLLVLTLGLDVYTFTGDVSDSFELTAHYNTYGVQVNGTSSENLAPEKLEALTKYLNKEEGSILTSYSTSTVSFPFYILSILFLLLTLGAMLSFKNYKRQIRLGRMAFFFTLLALITTVVMFYLSGSNLEALVGEEGMTKNIGFAFYALVLSVAFIFLGNIGVRRDQKLISSLDRLR
ncbi:protein of unknown function [Lishizhenia tianjinensis]|uniref:DUF4293 family protein n=1 Tax=Lishizhenia tianjinensis TaxID=477690 RepID=A0A1I6YAI8_9FLAO|nr:DUF4293 family protein [Lishizhenia tianjinensis]SFT47291.1 protein of unknown function [Lishizhenia tianjinensis]